MLTPMDKDSWAVASKARLLVGVCAALACLVIAPAAASACASPAGVHGFTGHAFISLTGNATATFEGASGSQTIGLDRKVANVQLNLTHKVQGKGPYAGTYFFSGKAKMGSVSVNDTFSSNGDGGSGEETYNGGTLSAFSSAEVVLDTKHCVYAVTAGFGVKTMYSGDAGLRPGSTVSVGAYSGHEKIPGNLHLIGGVGPDAYLTCPGNPILTGMDCMEFAGGWATDFAEFKECGTFPPQGDCATGEKPVGDGQFSWVLKPK